MLPAWGTPQPCGAHQAEVGHAWCHASHCMGPLTTEQLSLSRLFLSLPLGAQNQKETLALQPCYQEQRSGVGWAGLDLLSQGHTGSESQHLRGQGSRRLSCTMLCLRDGETDHLQPWTSPAASGAGLDPSSPGSGSGGHSPASYDGCSHRGIRVVLWRPHPLAGVSVGNAESWAPVPDSRAGADLGICILSKLV